MSDIKFSVVIPLYNKEKSIVNTVLSVLNQSYQNFEIVIVNDGSTDHSVDVIKIINDERIRLIHQENQGVSAARNQGVKEAKYDWIAFLDGDDLWKSNHLEEIIKMMVILPNREIYVTTFEYSNRINKFINLSNNDIFEVENYFKDAIKDNIIWSSNVVINKKSLNDVDGFNEELKYGEDLDLWFRLAMKFRIIKSKKITAIYRIEAENRSNNKQKIENCFDYYIDLTSIHNTDALNYIKFLINRRLYSYFRTCNFYDFFKLKYKQRNTFFMFFIWEKVIKKIKNYI